MTMVGEDYHQTQSKVTVIMMMLIVLKALRPHQATLFTVLLNDPVMKARMAAASTLALMLESPARAYLQVAEHRDVARSKSFTTLSSSLGQLVIQLHIGAHVIALLENFLAGARSSIDLFYWVDKCSILFVASG
ncbi:hypothetical protein R1flu_021309 [Riccia fluitans]|uniref:DUF4042 domain-containing protein n=1 Tax=Riccia fluitans TaxID=41844 RepID=A0ABD1ZQZ9_9MARC